MLNPETLHSELVFQTARSGGKGGQNVNKVETKVELRFDVAGSSVLSEEQKETIYRKLAGKLTNEHVLILYHQTERSQLANKDKVIAKFNQLIKNAFEVRKTRKATRPTLASRLEKRKGKERNAVIKSLRKKPTEE